MADAKNYPKDELEKIVNTIVNTIEGTICNLEGIKNHIEDIIDNDLMDNLDCIYDKLRNAGCLTHPAKDFSSNIVYMVDQLIERAALNGR